MLSRPPCAVSVRPSSSSSCRSLARPALPIQAGCPPVSADAWAVVNGREITREDVERAYRRNLQGPPPSSEEETAAAKLEVLDQLIVQDLLLARAREMKIELPDTELDAAYVEARKDIPDETFKQELARRNLTAADMREGLRPGDCSCRSCSSERSRRRSPSPTRRSRRFSRPIARSSTAPRTRTRVAQIAITPVREARITNRTGNDATTPEEAAAKSRMVMDRLKAGAPVCGRRGGLL